MIWLALAVAGVLVGLFGVFVWSQRLRLVRSRLRSRVIVTLKSGASFDGVLYAADREAWVLRDATALAAGERGASVPVDGEVLVLAGEIDYAQRP